MNLETKQTSHKNENTSNYNSPIEAEIANLEQQLTDLKFLCDNLDPYAAINPDHIALIKKYKIKDLDNPFAITNQLLTLVENTIEKLEKLKDKNE
jgi:hypothetical protein